MLKNIGPHTYSDTLFKIIKIICFKLKNLKTISNFVVVMLNW